MKCCARAELALSFGGTQLRDVELAVFFLKPVEDFAGDERGRGENELERLDFPQLCLEGFKCVDGKARGSDLDPRARRDRLPHVIAEQAVDIVDDFHALAGRGSVDWVFRRRGCCGVRLGCLDHPDISEPDGVAVVLQVKGAGVGALFDGGRRGAVG